MINKIRFYSKIGYKLIKKEVVSRDDYKEEYDKVSETYHYWLKEMGRYTDNIIHSKYIEIDKELKILDFACGTGYITKGLLNKSSKYKITSVDQSNKMLEKLLHLNDPINNLRVTAIQSDGIEFLKTTNEKYDVIFLGWALSYFDHNKLLKLFNRVLKPGGILAIITNVEGTLDKIENIFLDVMSEKQEEVIKPMDIKFNLPKGKKGLVRWCSQYGFKALEVEEGEAFFSFKEPEELLQWLNITGAAAGTRKIFKNYHEVKPLIIEKIKKEKYKNGDYEINHKFAYGIFRKE
ncbi:class I SAM-dependent methyltransferase [uncultured Clostridium sp.]|uniref:class I SAM-dependent methyltransferase n=1 Tax=uncultured Clostridium sp. TaxID=59620 RepID=UPI0028EA8637|nr:class I SAM-dependent methyltransferase [uncultured Clostridium sp.]